ncbi:MAG TPA: hypothetical protein PKD59_02270 [Miltoncostaeaceae bacterium]|nr:hypothetical protein [Miltoncostaeaceae bacterium]
MSHRGAPFLGAAGELRPADLAGRAGAGIVPGCDDVVGPGAPPPVPDTTVTLRRIAGVAPRFAVAMRLGGGDVAPMIRDGVTCARPTVGATLACLRATTARFLRGPSLIAPLSAPAGGTIRVALRLPGHAPAPPSGPLVLRTVGPPGVPAGPLVRSGGTVVLPDVQPGEYRLVALAGTDGDARGVAARITIR